MENWRDVVGFEGVYVVSATGRVRRLDSIDASGYHRHPREMTHTIRQGYPAVKLCRNGVGKHWMVHTLVAAAFLGPRPEGLFINHKDGNKMNCTPENLEYCTRGENEEHATAMGLKARGEGNSQAILTDERVRFMRDMHERGGSIASIARQVDMSYQQTHRVIRGKAWAHVSNDAVDAIITALEER